MLGFEALDSPAVAQMLSKSDDWHEARRSGIGGSDVNQIMSGDWTQLFLEKTGRAESPDLMDVLPVQMGSWTEPLNIWWFSRVTGIGVKRQKGALASPKYPFMRANVDGFPDDGAVLECKHVHAFTEDEKVVSNYYGQCQHLMEVTGRDLCYLSVFFGNAKWDYFDIARDDAYIAEMVEKERDFWENYVLLDIMPPLKAASAPVVVKFDDLREMDMSTSNSWVDRAADYLHWKAQAQAFAAAEKDLKAMVEPDVKRAFGAGIEIKRSKANALSIKELK